jgi:hypothetical protein
MDLTQIGGGIVFFLLVQERDQRQALVNTIINFRFHEKRGISSVCYY